MGSMQKQSARIVAMAWSRGVCGDEVLSTPKGRASLSEHITTVRNAAGVFFPLDQRLNLASHSLTPATIVNAVSSGVEIPSYRRAARQFTQLTHVALSASSLCRLVTAYGQKLVGLQAAEAIAMVQVGKAEAEVIWRQVPEPDSECMNISLDGALIHLRDEGWKEVKVATVSAVTYEVDEERGDWSMRLMKHSYRAGLWDAAEFAKQQWAEAAGRGVEKASYVSSVNDGAPWIWNITRMCYAQCVEILDWWHAVQRLWTIGHQRFGAETAEAAAWVRVQKGLLAQSRLRQIVRNIRRLYPQGQMVPDEVRKALSYLIRNRARMRYKEFRRAGYPIGSGSVESGCKVVAQTRLKQAGMRWSRQGAQAVLVLRSFLLSDRWSHATSLLGLT